MTKSILLVNPWIHDFSAYDLWMKPLGLLYLGAFLEKHNYKVYLIDCLNTHSRDRKFGCGKLPYQVIAKPAIFKDIPRKYKRYGITPETLSYELKRFANSTSPELILVTSMMTYWYPGVFETIRHLKNNFPNVPIVLGGIYATLCYEHAVKYSGADYVIKGPGEMAILKLANQLLSNQCSSVRATHELPLPDDLPYPAYHLYPVRNDIIKTNISKQSIPTTTTNISNGVYDSLSYVAMLTSRGCPFKCTYCASTLLYDGFYQRAPEKVFAEIEHYITKFKINDIAFYDDALMVNPENHIEPLLDLIISKGINKKVSFHTPNGLHIRYISQSIAQKLFDAGFKTLRLGFESNQLRWQSNSSGKVTNNEFIVVINNLKNAGYFPDDIGVYLMLGLPGQTIEEINKTIEFVKQNGCRIKIAQYAPIPGTVAFQKAVDEYGLNPDEPLLHNKSIYPLKPREITFEEMEKLKQIPI